ncbi:UTRA domain-containing protein, partial [Streptomyces tendae]
DGVVALSTSWLPGEFAAAAPELLSTGPLPKMTFGLIEERTGRRAVRRRDVVAIKEVPDDVAPLLGVTPGTSALSMTNHYWDQHGDTTEYAIDYLGTGRTLSADYDLD